MDAEWVRGKRGISRIGQLPTRLIWGVATLLPVALLPLHVPEANSAWVLLAVVGLIAEIATLRGRDRFLPYVMPVLAGVWWQFGPLAAWITELAVALAAMVGFNAIAGTLSNRSQDKAGLFARSLACASAGLGALWAGRVFATEAQVVIGPLLFGTLYLCMLMFVEKATTDRTHRSLRHEAIQVLVLLCLCVAAVVLMSNDAAMWLPLLLGPVAALRALTISRDRLEEAHYQTVDTLATMLQRAHPYTHRHLERVAEISEEVALRLGLSSKRAKMVHQAALLHDIGKIAIDEDILDLPRKLTDEEFEHVKLHAAYGGEILGQVDSMREMARWIRHHHERPDGRGYPEGLLDPEIPIESKIIAAVDAFDAMTGGMEGRDGRPFREPMSVDSALAELDRCSGTQFDPQVVKAFRLAIGGAA